MLLYYAVVELSLLLCRPVNRFCVMNSKRHTNLFDISYRATPNDKFRAKTLHYAQCAHDVLAHFLANYFINQCIMSDSAKEICPSNGTVNSTNHDEFQYLNLIENIIKNGKRMSSVRLKIRFGKLNENYSY